MRRRSLQRATLFIVLGLSLALGGDSAQAVLLPVSPGSIGFDASNTLHPDNHSNADYTGIILDGSTISGNFNDSNLTNASLINVDFTGANLRGTILVNADFGGGVGQAANLNGADISGANFAGVDLTGSNLANVLMDDFVDFSNANVSDVNFNNIDGTDFDTYAIFSNTTWSAGTAWPTGFDPVSEPGLNPVPEPSSCLLVFVGAMGLVVLRRRRS